VLNSESCINNSERVKEKREDAITQAFYVSIVLNGDYLIGRCLNAAIFQNCLPFGSSDFTKSTAL